MLVGLLVLHQFGISGLLQQSLQFPLYAIQLDAVDQSHDHVVEALLLGSVLVHLAEWFLVNAQFEGQATDQRVGMVREEPLGGEPLVMHMLDGLLQDALIEGRGQLDAVVLKAQVGKLNRAEVFRFTVLVLHLRHELLSTAQ